MKKDYIEFKMKLQMYQNPIIPGGTHELQIRYAQTIKNLFRKKNNLRQFAGRDYEGQPTSGAVKIPVRDTEVDVQDYDVLAGATLEQSATSYLTVIVDQHKAVNELIDGYEAAAVPDNMIAQRLDSGAFSLQRAEELNFIASIRDSITANDAGGGVSTPANPTYEVSVVASDSTTAYTNLSATIGTLIDEGVDPQDIKVGISTEFETLLLQDIKFTNTASEIGSDRVMLGVIGVVRGAEVTRSSNTGAVSATGANVAFNGNEVEYVVFSPLWAQAGDEWKVMPNIIDIRDGKHIGSSAMQGREDYFNALTDSKGSIVKSKTP